MARVHERDRRLLLTNFSLAQTEVRLGEALVPSKGPSFASCSVLQTSSLLPVHQLVSASLNLGWFSAWKTVCRSTLRVTGSQASPKNSFWLNYTNACNANPKEVPWVLLRCKDKHPNQRDSHRDSKEMRCGQESFVLIFQRAADDKLPTGLLQFR